MMKLKSYEVQFISEGGRAYCIVALQEGSSFGQWINVGTTEQMDDQIVEHIARMEQQSAAREIAPALVGVKRDAVQVEASRQERLNAAP